MEGGYIKIKKVIQDILPPIAGKGNEYFIYAPSELRTNKPYALIAAFLVAAFIITPVHSILADEIVEGVSVDSTSGEDVMVQESEISVEDLSVINDEIEPELSEKESVNSNPDPQEDGNAKVSGSIESDFGLDSDVNSDPESFNNSNSLDNSVLDVQNEDLGDSSEQSENSIDGGDTSEGPIVEDDNGESQEILDTGPDLDDNNDDIIPSDKNSGSQEGDMESGIVEGSETDGQIARDQENEDDIGSDKEDDVVASSGEDSTEISEELIRQNILGEILKELSVSSIEELKHKVEIADKNIYSNVAYNYKVQTSSVSSDLYSAKDSDADREIYISSGGEIVKITDNNREDDFPSWDLNKENIVWQSLIDGRWQIFFYNLSDKKEIQITNTTFNNTSPAVQGSVLVWQGWVDDNWEVFMAEYKNSTALGGSWSIKQLTDNYYHDMFPKISGNLIIWQAFYKENWHIFAYDLVKEQVYQISRGVGANENPRFAVVWDSRNPNGEFKSIAYDIVTGQPINLSFHDNKEDDKSSEMPLLPKTDNNEVPAVSIQSGPASKSDEGDNEPQE